MRKPFGRLVEEVQALSDAEMEMSMGAIAERLGVTVERLADAMDAVKMLNGEPTYIPLTERRPLITGNHPRQDGATFPLHD
jgi:hypothetical protein